MHRHFHRAFGLLILTSGLTCTVALAGEFPDEQQACGQRIATLKLERDSSRKYRAWLTVVGAVAAAGASAAAASLATAKKRKVAAGIGILAAAVTGWTQTLPDLADLQARISLATRHESAALKVGRQLKIKTLGEKDQVCFLKYVSARFTDCAREAAPEEVPDPDHCVATVVSPIIRGSNGPFFAPEPTP